MSEPTIDEQVANSKAKRSAIRKAWIYAAVLGVALACIAVLATLLWVRSNSDLTAVSESNDAGISQFEYCKKAPKTDPRCQEPVSKPADKIVQGPQGVQGIQGIEGPVGPQGPAGPRGPQGLPGNSPRCLLEPARCVGTAGTNGKDGVDGKDGSNGLDGKDGTNGLDGKAGVDGKDGANGTDGKDGADGKDGVNGQPPASWTWTDTQGVKYTCVRDGDTLNYTCTSAAPITPGIVGR